MSSSNQQKKNFQSRVGFKHTLKFVTFFKLQLLFLLMKQKGIQFKCNLLKKGSWNAENIKVPVFLCQAATKIKEQKMFYKTQNRKLFQNFRKLTTNDQIQLLAVHQIRNESQRSYSQYTCIMLCFLFSRKIPSMLQ